MKKSLQEKVDRVIKDNDLDNNGIRELIEALVKHAYILGGYDTFVEQEKV